MPVAPEFQVLILIVVSLFVAYGGIYPTMKPLTLMRLVYADLIVSIGLVIVSGLLFFGKQIGFSLLFWSVPWWVYLMTMLIVFETPIFLWFANKHNLDFDDD